MTIDKLYIINEIENRIKELQKSHLSLQDQLKNADMHFEQQIHHSALRVIDILDLIHVMTGALKSTVDENIKILIEKIEKRLIDILKRWQIEEIQLKDGCVQVGKTRVLETRPASENQSPGSIVEICRKGYQRGDKVIRPADVIAAKN